ncbi:hypothetical protein NEF87_001224 [Candidatus Lokiarchaeum ossiferum]|uniref:ABC3 transporter permease C-terminal domain-containing protein n=1 Tax=Candidatus Lokiarchaeum ossiferum TaxID=2951803 RepID=A0ABY6HR29_9ARCH|nr:hypothetical protein NEF87_001224 [Candidatus Lokiarchaeum sp. B-35]
MRKIDFYWKKSWSDQKKNLAIIICVSFALAMISGFSFFYESVQNYNFEKSFTQSSDFSIYHAPQQNADGQFISPLNFAEYSNITKPGVEKAFSSTDLDVTGYYNFASITHGEAFFSVKNISRFTSKGYNSGFNFLSDTNATGFQYILAEDDFYKSERFNDYFIIIEGESPNSDNEILVDYQFARKFDLRVNEISNITTMIGAIWPGTPLNINYQEFIMENITISGIYLPKDNLIGFNNLNFRYSYTYQNYVDEVVPSDDFTFESPGTFSYYNFSGTDLNHPVQQHFSQIAADTDASRYLRSTNIVSGYSLFFNRAAIKFETISHQKTIISQHAFDFSLNLPLAVVFNDNLGLFLQEQANSSRLEKYLFQIFNLPFIIFAGMISKKQLNRYYDNQKEEILILQGRGISKSILNTQIKYSAFLRSFITSIIGTSFGCVFFFGYKKILGNVLIIGQNAQILPFITVSDLFLTFLVSLAINFAATISIIQKIKKQDLSKIAASMKIEDLSSDFDENKLFGKEKEGEKLKKFAQNLEHDKNQKKYHKKTQKRKKKQKKNEIFEENAGDFFNNRIKPTSILQICVGLLPLILLFIIFLGNNISLPDSLIDLTYNLEQLIPGIILLCFICLGQLVSGIGKIFFLERPKIFSKLAKRISRVFLQDLDMFISTNLVKKKQWGEIASYLSIFIALLVASNINYSSTQTYEFSMNNYLVGADLRLEITTHNFTSMENIQEFEENLTNFRVSNRKLVNEVVSCFTSSSQIQTTVGGVNVSVSLPIYTLDLQKYEKIITEMGKPVPYSDYNNKISEIQNFNTENEVIGAIVSPTTLSRFNKNIGDQLEIKIPIYNSSTDSYYYQELQIEFIEVLDLMPGLFYDANDFHTNELGVILDLKSIPVSDNDIIGNSIIQLMDLKISSNNDWELIESNLITVYENQATFLNIWTYNQDWDDFQIEIHYFDFGSRGFYKLTFLIIVLLGVFIGIHSAFTIQSVLEEEKTEIQNLFRAGFEDKNLLKIVIIETSIMIFLAILVGGLVGTIYGTIQHKLTFNYVLTDPEFFYSSTVHFPTSINLSLLIGGILPVVCAIFLLQLLLLSNKWIGMKRKNGLQNKMSELALINCLAIGLALQLFLKLSNGIAFGMIIGIIWFSSQAQILNKKNKKNQNQLPTNVVKIKSKA